MLKYIYVIKSGEFELSKAIDKDKENQEIDVKQFHSMNHKLRRETQRQQIFKDLRCINK